MISFAEELFLFYLKPYTINMDIESSNPEQWRILFCIAWLISRLQFGQHKGTGTRTASASISKR